MIRACLWTVSEERPGVYSARYAGGEGHDSAANTALLLKNLTGKTDRRARFRTVIALTEGPDSVRLFEGSVEGEIMEQPAGCGGFGYDPVFRPLGWDKTFAEASADGKKCRQPPWACNPSSAHLAKRQTMTVTIV